VPEGASRSRDRRGKTISVGERKPREENQMKGILRDRETQQAIYVDTTKDVYLFGDCTGNPIKAYAHHEGSKVYFYFFEDDQYGLNRLYQVSPDRVLNQAIENQSNGEQWQLTESNLTTLREYFPAQQI
jgi:hypothetical protein